MKSLSHKFSHEIPEVLQRHGRLLFSCLLFSWLLLAASLIAAIRPDWLGLQSRHILENLQPYKAYAWQCPTPSEAHIAGPNRIFPIWQPAILEDGTPLPARVQKDKAHTIIDGYGRYLVLPDRCLFATSDNSSPQSNGRTYELVTSLYSPGDLSLLLLGALLIWNTRLLSSMQRLRAWLPKLPGPVSITVVAMGPLVFMPAFGALKVPANGFFEGNWALLLFALGFTAARAVSNVWVRRIATLGYAAMLLGFAWQHFVVGAASDSQNIIAGSIPWGDALMFLKQADGMALRGQMPFGFNGRLLYPLLFSTWLTATKLDVQLACLADVALFAFAGALAIRAVYLRVGFGGAVAFTLTILFYYQSYCCMRIMTENLGLSLGLIGLSFLLQTGPPASSKNYWLSLATYSLATAARPAAVFALAGPAVAILETSWSRVKALSNRLRIMALICAGIAGIGLSGFVFNSLVVRMVLDQPSSAYGNSLFFIYGVVTDTQWNDAHRAFGRDFDKGRKMILQSLWEHPEKAAAGVMHAYYHMFEQAYLYGRYQPYRNILSLLSLAGLIACLFHERFRRDRRAVAFSLLGFSLSIPIAPPWPIGMRAYAVFIPVLALLVACGIWVVLRLAGLRSLPDSPEATSINKPTLCLAFLIVAALVAPLIGLLPRQNDFLKKLTGEQAGVALLKGSTLHVGRLSNRFPGRTVISLQDFKRNASFFLESQPKAAFLNLATDNSLIGYDRVSRIPCIMSTMNPSTDFEILGTPANKAKVQRELLDSALRENLESEM